MERNPGVCHALKETTDWEVASHGYRWLDYQNIDSDIEREHMLRTIDIHERLLGKRPVGFYLGKVLLQLLLLCCCVYLTSFWRFLFCHACVSLNRDILLFHVFISIRFFLHQKPNIETRKLVVEEGGFKYDSDSYADDLPYWTLESGGTKHHLVIPYTLTENDMRFVSPANFSTGAEFCQHLKDTLKYVSLSCWTKK